MSSALVETLTSYFTKTKDFSRVISKLKILSLENGRAVAELKVAEEHTNMMGQLHGGMSATLLDALASCALKCHRRMAKDDVAPILVNLNIEFVRAAKIGDEIQIIAETNKAGRSLAFLETFIKDKKTGDLLVKGSHVKFFSTIKVN